MKTSPLIKAALIIAVGALILRVVLVPRGNTSLQRQSSQGITPTSTATQSSKWHLSNLCQDIPIELINSAVGKKPTRVEHGQTKIHNKTVNYYCKIIYPADNQVFIAYELGSLEKHLESLKTLKIPYKKLEGFKHLAILDNSAAKDSFLKISDSAYLSISSTHPLPEDKLLEILHSIDKSY